MNSRPRFAPRRPGSDPGPAGFTMVELAVSVSVAALLTALVLPAVHASRAAARRSACLNNLRQIGLAMHGYESTHGLFPPGSLNLNTPHRRMLPWLEQKPLDELMTRRDASEDFRLPDGAGVVPAFTCPEGEIDGQTFRTNYGYSVGSGTLPDRGDGVFGPWTKVRDVKDGLANTTAFVEIAKLYGTDAPHAGVLWNISDRVDLDDPDAPLKAAEICLDARPPGTRPAPAIRTGGWKVSIPSETGVNNLLPPNTNSCLADVTIFPASGTSYRHSTKSASLNAASPHRGGVHAALADGAARFVSDDVDPSLWRAVGSRDGGEVVEGF